MRHLWNRQTSPWDSEHTEKTDLKLRDSCQSAASQGSQSIAPKVSCSSCTDGLCQNCKTTNGPVERLVQSNGTEGPVRTQEKTADHLPIPAQPNHANSGAIIKTEDASLKPCSGTEVSACACVKSEPSTPLCDHKKTPSASDAAATKLSASTGVHAVKPQKITTSKGQRFPSSSCGKCLLV